uniref:Uncharacterized protein n=1 Tax=Anguilla anguilla TaxID=7936 RepID=A0A0E9S2R7_ANGAN
MVTGFLLQDILLPRRHMPVISLTTAGHLPLLSGTFSALIPRLFGLLL